MFDLDSAVRAQFDDLIGRMRAKRLSEELPPPAESVAPEPTDAPDDSGDQAALESMLDPG